MGHVPAVFFCIASVTARAGWSFTAAATAVCVEALGAGRCYDTQLLYIAIACVFGFRLRPPSRSVRPVSQAPSYRRRALGGQTRGLCFEHAAEICRLEEECVSFFNIDTYE